MSSKKEEQRRIKEEKQAAAAQKEKVGGLLTKIALGILVPLVVGVLLFGFFSGQQAVPPSAVVETDHVRGNSEAAITLTVYADFQCPACGEETRTMARAWPRISDKVRLVFRHYPLDMHNHAFPAARVAEAAGRQNKFWEMHDILYANQVLWSSVDDPLPLFDGYAMELGLNIDQLHADMELSDIRDKIIADQRGGTRAGVIGTPTLFLNGRQIATPRSPTELISKIEEAAAE
ncbi:MAG: thioredoxin domain-containing protein [Pseudomonadota bacterium]